MQIRHGCIGTDFATSYRRQNLRFPKYEVLPPGKRRNRLGLVSLVAALWSCVLVWRLYELQISNVDVWQKWGLKQHVTEFKLASERGPIYDRYGRLMAVSVPAGSVYVRPSQLEDRQAAATEVAQLLGMKKEAVLEKFSARKPFVWLKRQAPRQEAEKLEAANLPGVGYLLESRRYYPYNEAASALVGKVGVDGSGLSGVELLYDSRLQAEHKESLNTRDALGNMIEVSDVSPDGVEIPRGDSLKLTIDAEIQAIVDEELAAAKIVTGAKATMAVMVDAVSGDILAMGQAPALNNNVASKASKEQLKNLAVETVLEPGSIMKPIVAAAAIDQGLFRPEDLINCENGRFPFGRHTIKDVHPSGVISLHNVVVRSSNIGMTKVGLRLGSERLYDALVKFGFGKSLKLGLAGETSGILRNVSSWAPVDVATHAFGQGVAVTPLQVVRAVSAIANGGVLPNLHFVMQENPQAGKRIISEKAATAVREMMYGVVEDEHGTGQKARIHGVRVGGKTGTAQKARNGGRGYLPGVYTASFVGFVDASEIGLNRIITLIVMVDEPHGGSIYGGTLAAPVFEKIMQRSFHVLSAAQELKEKPSAAGKFVVSSPAAEKGADMAVRVKTKADKGDRQAFGA